jgi:surfactin synthase thioesterase subunit
MTPITALGGSEDPETTRDELEAWREHTTHFGGVRLFAGHHFYLQSQWVTVADAVALAGADD